MKKRILKYIKKTTKILPFAILFFLSACGVFLILFNVTFSKKIYPRIAIARNDIGNLNPEIAQKTIENKISLWRNEKIQINYSNTNDPTLSKNWQIKPSELGITQSYPKDIITAYNIGRTKNFLKRIKQIIILVIKGKNIPTSYDLDEKKFTSYIENNFSILEKSGKNASLVFVSGNLKEIPSQSGYSLDRDNLKQKIINKIQNLKSSPVSIKMFVSSPNITNDKIKSAEKKANNLITKNFSLKFEKKSWTLDKKLIKSSLSFVPVQDPTDKNKSILGIKINSKPISDYLEKIQIEINHKPTNAVFGIKDKQIIVESGGETGISLSIDKSTEKIINKIREESINNNNDVEIKLVIEKKEPVIGIKTLKDIGIDSLLGQGISNFAGSPKNRRQNIAVGAAKFNNIFIQPDEEFSFVKTLGEITAKAGYLPDLVIKTNKIIPELGGGLCQVSTTAFRAAIYSGLPITERRPHAYAVGYYAPQGIDSTIYPPHPDLRFKNDTGKAILIQTKIVRNKLTFNFFGAKQDRTIKVIGPKTYERKPDGSMKTIFWREFYKKNVLQKKEPFYSSYASPKKYHHKNPLE